MSLAPERTGIGIRRHFTKPGVHYYICTPHPWMYGQIIVEP